MALALALRKTPTEPAVNPLSLSREVLGDYKGGGFAFTSGISGGESEVWELQKRGRLQRLRSWQQRGFGGKALQAASLAAPRECTFSPNLAQSASSLRLSLRSLGGMEEGSSTLDVCDAAFGSWEASQVEQSHEDAECTGRPQTNEVPPHMLRAQSYVRQNVFERLSSQSSRGALLLGLSSVLAPSAADEAGGGSNTPSRTGRLDAPSEEQLASSLGASLISSVQSGRAEVDVPVKENLAPQGLPGDEASRQEKPSSKAFETFCSFLQRQNEREDHRRRHLREIEEETAPSLQPELSANSRRMVQRQRSTSSKPGIRKSFSTDALGSGCSGSRSLSPRRRHEVSENIEPEYCFRPQIRPSSAKRPLRGVDELSAGDLQRREAHRSERREQLAAEERELLTFEPQLNRMPSSVRGKLRVLEEPDCYIPRLAQDSALALARRERELQHRMDQALAECTFRPQVLPGPPAYVRRLAEAHREVQGYRAQLQEESVRSNPRPEWRFK
ncbi:unnamed protein product [Polarella glacialis]|uniref:Uncharacterized protein n=1 Tax=Polarella glacialis TaxID=89957 RepID=A0A813G833_POLGL|nr:unnamed protein product [Polarella glacialis]